jgi:hypothetical protein
MYMYMYTDRLAVIGVRGSVYLRTYVSVELMYATVCESARVSDLWACVCKVKFAIEQALNAQRGSRSIALLFL